MKAVVFILACLMTPAAMVVAAIVAPLVVLWHWPKRWRQELWPK